MFTKIEITSVPVRHQFRKFLIPMLFVLKLFKLKLLLFLPLIFGLVSFKKFLGLLAIAIPGIIGFIKFYKPSNYFQPVYTTNGIGYPHYGESNIGYHEDHYTGSYGQDLAYKGYQHYKSWLFYLFYIIYIITSHYSIIPLYHFYIITSLYIIMSSLYHFH